MFATVAWMVLSGGCERARSVSDRQSDKDVGHEENVTMPSSTSRLDVNVANTETAHAVDLAGIEWFEDDLAGATARAISTTPSKPVLVDMWASWCHTCLSMRQTVLRDAALATYADKFVWLALDTERSENAELVQKLNMSMWPTFYVLDPADQSVQAVFAGGASVEQFGGFLADGRASFRAKQGGRDAVIDEAQRWMRRAASAVAAKSFDEAEAALVRALALAPEAWSRRPEALVELIRVRYKQEAFDRCAALVSESMDAVMQSKSASVTDFTVYGSRCLKALPTADRERALRQMIAGLVKLEGDSGARLSVDDRSDLLYNLRGLYEALKDIPAARSTAVRQRDLLMRAAKAARSPREAMIYAWPRAEVHVYLDEAASLEPELVALYEALPEEYDPPYRLGWLRMQGGDFRGAVGPLERALSRVYGPRKAKVWSLLADAYGKLGDGVRELQAREGIVAHLRALPAGLGNETLESQAIEALRAARKRLTATR